MGCTQSAFTLWSAMISFSRQIGLLGVFQGVIGAGLGDQLYQICGASWADAGASVRNRAAAAGKKLRDFIKIAPQAYVFVIETMSALQRGHNCSSGAATCGKRV